MITYKASYTFDADDWVCGQVLDFPAALSQGQGVDDARRMLQSALVDAAETMILMGQPLPQPDPRLSDENADIEEPIHLLLTGATQVQTIPADAA
jgi:predicted RNase H-like HicB family nuclease